MEEAANILHCFNLSVRVCCVMKILREAVFNNLKFQGGKTPEKLLLKTATENALLADGNHPVMALQNETHKTNGLGVTD